MLTSQKLADAISASLRHAQRTRTVLFEVSKSTSVETSKSARTKAYRLTHISQPSQRWRLQGFPRHSFHGCAFRRNRLSHDGKWCAYVGKRPEQTNNMPFDSLVESRAMPSAKWILQRSSPRQFITFSVLRYPCRCSQV